MRNAFGNLARVIADALGSAYAFVIAAAAVIVWVALGPLFGFSPQWQLWINTGTTIITFLMVFVIQNTENRDTRAMQIKLDELLRALGGARAGLVDIEKLSDEELTKLRDRFSELQQRYSDETRDAQKETRDSNET